MTLSSINLISYCWIALAVAIHITMFYVTAPFGRHTSEKWGVSLDNRLGWIIMELPSLGIMTYFLLSGAYSFDSYVWLLFGLWIFHYINRTLIYPFRIRPTPKKMPLFIVLNAIFFNFVNAGLNGYYLAELAPPEKYGEQWLHSTHLWLGLVLFFTGMYINWKSDNILIHLRKPGETGYKIPQGFLFNRITSPNLFGEILEWSGFACMAWNLPALTFMVWTYANLVPRAKNHHDWYLRHFDAYPKDRKVVFPFIF